MNSLVAPIEVFHLLLLGALPPRPGQHFAVLKGGGNLRFFHASPRYSQDLDFDAPTPPSTRSRPRSSAR